MVLLLKMSTMREDRSNFSEACSGVVGTGCDSSSGIEGESAAVGERPHERRRNTCILWMLSREISGL